MNFLRYAAVVGAVSASTLGFAADLGSVTLSLAETEASFSGGPILGTNAAGDVVRCVDPIMPCDTVSLTVEVPDDVADFYPTGLFRATVAPSDSPSGADDYDLFLYDSGGATLASSTSETGTETVVGILRGGTNNYTVEVEHWLVVGGSFDLKIVLDLGEPSEEKTAEELAAWLDENSAIATNRALSRRNAEACVAPGLALLTDASGDVNPFQILPAVALPVSNLDLTELSVFQQGSTENDDDPALIGFRMKAESLAGGVVPNSAFYTSFAVGATQLIFGVRMAVDIEGNVSFFSYVAGANNDGGIDGRFIELGSERPADAASYYDDSGEIVIFVRPIDVGLFEPGESLTGFNAASTTGVSVPGVGGLISGTVDEMPDGLGRSGIFTYMSDAKCAGDADEGTTESTSRSTSVAGSSAGGSLGWLAMVLVLLGWSRRQR